MNTRLIFWLLFTQPNPRWASRETGSVPWARKRSNASIVVLMKATSLLRQLSKGRSTRNAPGSSRSARAFKTNCARVAASSKPRFTLLGRVIEHHRTQRKVQQEQIATSLGITQSAYSKLEKGQSAISVMQLNTVAAGLQMQSATILQGAERYAAHLRQQGVEITNEKQDSSAAGLLIALGLLAALIAAAGS